MRSDIAASTLLFVNPPPRNSPETADTVLMHTAATRASRSRRIVAAIVPFRGAQ